MLPLAALRATRLGLEPEFVLPPGGPESHAESRRIASFNPLG